jgi:hypothetical protein
VPPSIVDRALGLPFRVDVQPLLVANIINLYNFLKKPKIFSSNLLFIITKKLVVLMLWHDYLWWFYVRRSFHLFSLASQIGAQPLTWISYVPFYRTLLLGDVYCSKRKGWCLLDKISLFQHLNLANSNKLRFDESHRLNKSIKKDGVILMVSNHVLNPYKPYLSRNRQLSWTNSLLKKNDSCSDLRYKSNL